MPLPHNTASITLTLKLPMIIIFLYLFCTSHIFLFTLCKALPYFSIPLRPYLLLNLPRQTSSLFVLILNIADTSLHNKSVNFYNRTRSFPYCINIKFQTFQTIMPFKLTISSPIPSANRCIT